MGYSFRILIMFTFLEASFGIFTSANFDKHEN